MNRSAIRSRLDMRLSDVRVPERPHRGWLRAIRDALGISGAQLGSRLGVSQQRISQIEHAEVDGTLTISSLTEIADALGCDFVYALVPRAPLDEIVREQAWRKASELVGPVDQTMALEGQRVDADRTRELVVRLAAQLVDSRRLWS